MPKIRMHEKSEANGKIYSKFVVHETGKSYDGLSLEEALDAHFGIGDVFVSYVGMKFCRITIEGARLEIDDVLWIEKNIGHIESLQVNCEE